MSNETEEMEIRVVIDTSQEETALGMPRETENKVLNWIKQGQEYILNLSTTGLADAAETIRTELEELTEGEWEMAELELTITAPPSIKILIKKKS
jgi:hypothetical protein